MKFSIGISKCLNVENKRFFYMGDFIRKWILLVQLIWLRGTDLIRSLISIVTIVMINIRKKKVKLSLPR
jgi:hypothetical protein